MALLIFLPLKVFLKLPSVLWHCWLGISKSIRSVKNDWWGTGVIICLECGANDLHMVQLMPLPPNISCFSKIQKGLPFWCWLTWVVLEKRPLNVCMYVCRPDIKGLCVIWSISSYCQSASQLCNSLINTMMSLFVTVLSSVNSGTLLSDCVTFHARMGSILTVMICIVDCSLSVKQF